MRILSKFCFQLAAWLFAPALLLLALVLPALLLPALPANAQIEEEDLPPDTFTRLTYERLSLEELEQRFRAAEEAFRAAEDLASPLPAFDDLIRILEERLAAGSLPAVERVLLADSLSYRIRINFNLGANDAVGQDLEHLLAVQPEHQLDPDLVSPKLIDLLERKRRQLVGHADVLITPADAEVRIDGRLVETGGEPVSVLAGSWTLSAARLGYAPIEMEVEIPAGERTPIEVQLERTSAVLVVVTQPAGARVTIEGQDMGTTPVAEGPVSEGAASERPASEGPASGDPASTTAESEPLRLEGLQTGAYRLEVTKEGYRPYRARIQLPELRDYATGTLALERTEAEVLLQGLGPQARVQVDGREVRVERLGRDAGRLRLAPGDFRLNVTDGTRGVFEAGLQLADRQTLEVTVRLQPGLVFLGVQGGDRVAAEELTQIVLTVGRALDGWALLDRSEAGLDLLHRLGVDTANLRRAADPAVPNRTGADWGRLQAAADQAMPGAVYLMAVLSDDLMASHADLWFWPAAPGPARPDHTRVALRGASGSDSGDDGDALARVIRAAGQPVQLVRPWFGALLIDSDAANGPVIAEVVADSPAAAAGVRLGERVVAVFNRNVTSALEVEQQLDLAPGASVSITLENSSGRRVVDFQLGTSPAVVPLDDPDQIYATVSAALSRARLEGQDVPGWLLDLNQAAVFLQGSAWEEAVRVLRGVQAPRGAGLGQAAVDYWLAIALRAASPAYQDQARQALERAAASPGGRLFHNDGPLVAPRARARLLELGE